MNNKQVLLLEDRIPRQENFLRNLNEDIFNKYALLIDNKINGSFGDIKQKFSEKDFSILEGYNCIALHYSAFDKEVTNAIYELCKKQKKSLIYFSGGISSSFLDESNGFSFLTINSKTFYSKNLIIFLENIKNNKKINIGLLSFGDKLELSLLLSLRQQLSFTDEIFVLDESTSVEEIDSKFKIYSNYIQTLLKNNLSWYKENKKGIPTKESIVEIKKIVSREIADKLIFQ